MGVDKLKAVVGRCCEFLCDSEAKLVSKIRQWWDGWQTDLKSNLIRFSLRGAVVVAALILVYYFTGSDSKEKLAQMGDFLGGSLNPILTFFTVIGLLYTIHLQREALKISKDELAATREELKSSAKSLALQHEAMQLQNFETQFNSQLELLNRLFKSADEGGSNLPSNMRFNNTSSVAAMNLLTHVDELCYLIKYYSGVLSEKQMIGKYKCIIFSLRNKFVRQLMLHHFYDSGKNSETYFELKNLCKLMLKVFYENELFDNELFDTEYIDYEWQPIKSPELKARFDEVKRLLAQD